MDTKGRLEKPVPAQTILHCVRSVITEPVASLLPHQHSLKQFSNSQYRVSLGCIPSILKTGVVIGVADAKTLINGHRVGSGKNRQCSTGGRFCVAACKTKVGVTGVINWATCGSRCR